MPKLTPFETIDEKTYSFETIVKVTDNDFKINAPMRMGKLMKNKKIKVIIEVLDE
jgi:hypothetical protein